MGRRHYVAYIACELLRLDAYIVRCDHPPDAAHSLIALLGLWNVAA